MIETWSSENIVRILFIPVFLLFILELQLYFFYAVILQASKKKVYMLYDLQPDRSVTGGAWYSDQDFESEFVDVLTNQCHKFLLNKVRAQPLLCGCGMCPPSSLSMVTWVAIDANFPRL